MIQLPVMISYLVIVGLKVTRLCVFPEIIFRKGTAGQHVINAWRYVIIQAQHLRFKFRSGQLHFFYQIYMYSEAVYLSMLPVRRLNKNVTFYASISAYIPTFGVFVD